MEYCDALLVNPPSKAGDVFEHLGLGYLAACLRKRDINVKILNMPTYSINKFLEEITRYQAKILGISIPFQDGAQMVFNLISRLKKTGFDAHICIGGIFPTFSYKEILANAPCIDSIVLGEGEETFVELTEALINNIDWREISGIAYREHDEIVTGQSRPLITELDQIPFPERDVLPEVLKKLSFATMLTSRGCYGRCSFCSVVPFFSQFGPKYRMRSSQNVIEELDILYNKYGVRNVEFNDANFIGGKGRGSNRASDIASGILSKNMDLHFSIQCRADDVEQELFTVLNTAGLKKVFLGIESGSQSMLDRFRKDTTVEDNFKAIEILSKLDLTVFMGFITFDDLITQEEFKENINFLRIAKKMIPSTKLIFDPIAKLLPLAGTEAEKRLKEAEKYIGNSLRFSYRLDDHGLNLFYNTLSGLSNFARGLRKGLNIANDYNAQWVKKQ